MTQIKGSGREVLALPAGKKVSVRTMHAVKVALSSAIVFLCFCSFSIRAAELDGFDINTTGRSVTVTLFTSQDSPYTVQQLDRQFSITLPNTSLSENQLAQGMPVVIDNKNQFIGRAVTSGSKNGKRSVKVILPNLPENKYKVKVIQKRPGQAIAKGLTVYPVRETNKKSVRIAQNTTRSGESSIPDNKNKSITAYKSPNRKARKKAAETLLKTRSQPVAQLAIAQQSTQKTAKVLPVKKPQKKRLTLAKTPFLAQPLQQTAQLPEQSNKNSNPNSTSQNPLTIKPFKTIWNPYVIQKDPSQQPFSEKNENNATRQTNRPIATPQDLIALQQLPLAQKIENQAWLNASPFLTPSPWYSMPDYGLPPVTPTNLPLANLASLDLVESSQTPPEKAGLENAKSEITVSSESNKTLTPEDARIETNQTHSFITALNQAINPVSWFQQLPNWLHVSLGIFLGGIGVLALMGAILILTIVFKELPIRFKFDLKKKNGRTGSILPTNILRNVVQTSPETHNSASETLLDPFQTEKSWSKAPVYKTLPKLNFGDSRPYQSLRYLRSTPKTMADATQAFKKSFWLPK